MLITFNFDNINLLSLQFLILIFNDFLLHIIFYIWYLLYQLNIIISPNPLFAYYIMLFYNSLVLYFMISKKFSIDKILFYIFIIIIFRIIPIYYMITLYNLHVDYKSIYTTFLIIITYLLSLIIINNILLHNDINLLKIIKDTITSSKIRNNKELNFITIDYNNNNN